MRCLSFFGVLVLGMVGIAAMGDSQILLAAPPRIQTNPKQVTHDYEMTASDTCKVRTLILPDGVDANKMSFDEKRKRKGNASEQNLPGYKAAFEDIEQGDVVQVTAGKPQVSKTSNTTQYTGLSQTQGTVTKCDPATKTVTLKISSTTITYRGQIQKNQDNTVTVVDAAEQTITQIVILQHAKAPAANPARKAGE